MPVAQFEKRVAKAVAIAVAAVEGSKEGIVTATTWGTLTDWLAASGRGPPRRSADRLRAALGGLSAVGVVRCAGYRVRS
jgi:hypothetical protein